MTAPWRPWPKFAFAAAGAWRQTLLSAERQSRGESARSATFGMLSRRAFSSALLLAIALLAAASSLTETDLLGHQRTEHQYHVAGRRIATYYELNEASAGGSVHNRRT